MSSTWTRSPNWWSPNSLAEGSGPWAGCGLATGEGDGRSRRSNSPDCYSGPADAVPAVGGCAHLQAPHSAWLLQPEVVLFEPSAQDIFHGGSPAKEGSRQIFLNTPLSEAEVVALRRLRAALGGQEFPEHMGVHALRWLQYCKYNVTQTMDIMRIALAERVRRLPVAEAEVLPDLRSGFVYWHGRDRNCRPCLVIRMERLGTIASDKDRVMRLMLFVLEYALRYALVPGRVENWVVIFDLANVLSVVPLLQMGSYAAAAVSISSALEKVYSCRMAWLKLVNLPGNAVLRRVLNSTIRSEVKDKVSFPKDTATELARHFEPGQLERRYGGAAPDLKPEETYPFHFFPNARGSTAERSEPEVADTALHTYTTRAFHEGTLWDESCEAPAGWHARARGSSLTPDAAEALGRIAGGPPVQPCRDMGRWRQLVLPSGAEGPCCQQSSNNA